MAERRPLCVVGTDVIELPVGDTLPGGAGGGGSVPTRIPSGSTFTVALDTQALFALPIELEGDAMLVLDGALVEVS